MSLPNNAEIVTTPSPKKIRVITVTLENDPTHTCLKVYPGTGCVTAMKEGSIETYYTDQINRVVWNNLRLVFELEESFYETLQMP